MTSNLGSSPRKVSAATHAINPNPTVRDRRQEHRRLMKGKWVKMAVGTFKREVLCGDAVKILEDFRLVRNPFKDMVPEGQPEEEMYDSFVKLLNASGLLQGLRAVVTDKTPYGGDRSKQRPDVGLFREEEVPENSSPAWHDQLLHFEFKSKSVQDDPFNDEEDAGDFEHVSNEREENRGQFISYSAKQFECQQRCHVFSVGIFGHHARLFRWDRSGCIVTNSFDYTTTRHLCDFLYLFSRLSPPQQGYDPTAILIAKDSPEADFMREMAKERDEKCSHIRKFFEESLDDMWPWWKLHVKGPVSNQIGGTSTSERQIATREYLVGKPHFITDSVVGRGTRGYVAIECESQEFVWLKDAWRVDHEGIEQEGKILQVLNDHRIKNIPTVLHHGDVGNQCTLSPQYGPQSDSGLDKENGPQKENDLPKKNGRRKKNVPQRKSGPRKTNGSEKENGPQLNPKEPKPLKLHRHYRLVVKEVCRPMKDFRNGKELVRLIYQCMQAHKEVMERANLFHRDLSSGNLMMYEYVGKGDQLVRVGMLCDWELSKPLPKEGAKNGGEGPRQPDRTGTWQFMSVHALNDASWTITIEDELESFFYVLLWFAVRYVRHNFTRTQVGDFMHYYFDEGRPWDDDWHCGVDKQRSIETGVVKYSATQLKFYQSDEDVDGLHPLNDIIQHMLPWFTSYYRVVDRASNTLSTSSASEDDKFSETAHPEEEVDPDEEVNSYQEGVDPSGEEADPDEEANSDEDADLDEDADPDEEDPYWRPQVYLVDLDDEAEHEREERERLVQTDRRRAQHLESHAAILTLFLKAMDTAKWPRSDKVGNQVPAHYKPGERKEGKGKLEGKGRSKPGKRKSKPQKRKSKHSDPPESEEEDEDEESEDEREGLEDEDEAADNAPGPSMRVMTAKGRSKAPAVSTLVETATRRSTRVTARIDRSQRSAAPELVDSGIRRSTRTTAGLSRSKRPAPTESVDEDDLPRRKRTNTGTGRSQHGAAPEPVDNPTRRSTRTTVEQSKSKRPAPTEPVDEDEAPKRKRTNASTGRSQRVAAPKVENPARPTATTSWSQSSASEPADEASRPRTRGTSRSHRSSAPERVNNDTRPRTRTNAGTSRSKRPSPESADDDDPTRLRKRTRLT